SVDHDFDLLAGLLQEHLLNPLDNRLACARKQLDGLFGCLVRAKQTILLVIPAAVDRFPQDILEVIDSLPAVLFKYAFRPLAAVDVTGQYTSRIVQDRLRLVGEDNFTRNP